VAAARLVGLLLKLDEEENDAGLFLFMSHLSRDDARPVLLLLFLLPEELLLTFQCSAASASPGLGGDLIGVLLHASHLSTASARATGIWR
jgi:hypothetical protein